MANSKTLLTNSFSTDYSNGKNCYTKYNHLSIAKYKINQKIITALKTKEKGES